MTAAHRRPSTRARNAIALVFALNGLAFSSWVSRIPEARGALDLTPSQLGWLLFALSVGSLLALPTSGALVDRFGAARVVAGGAVADAAGLVLTGIGVGVLGEAWVAAGGLFVYGLGVGVWDVAMNIEGAAVERVLGRTIMPRFHAAFSLGTVLGAGGGVLASALGVPIPVHLSVVAVLAAGLAIGSVRAFLPAAAERKAHREAQRSTSSRRDHPMRAWLEPRTLLIGLMVLALALTEGIANDWLAVALVDGYGVAEWTGAAGYAGFVVAMTIGRTGGTVVLDRFGRVQVLWATMAMAACGVLLIVLGGWLPLVVLGIVLWGLGASLGFPVGMSAAADQPERAAARVSVVSTIGYTAFLAGPPVVGFIADHVGTLDALLFVSILLVPSALVVPAARKPAARGDHRTAGSGA